MNMSATMYVFREWWWSITGPRRVLMTQFHNCMTKVYQTQWLSWYGQIVNCSTTTTRPLEKVVMTVRLRIQWSENEDDGVMGEGVRWWGVSMWMQRWLKILMVIIYTCSLIFSIHYAMFFIQVGNRLAWHPFKIILYHVFSSKKSS